MKTRFFGCCLALVGVLLLAGCGGSPQEKSARYLARGKAYMEKRDYTRAALEFSNAVRTTPKDPDSCYQLALAYLSLDRTREAVDMLRRTVALNPKHLKAQLKLTELMLVYSVPDPNAARRVDEALAANPDDVDALFVRAAVDARMGKAEDAEKYLEKTLEQSPQYLKSSLALASMKMGKRDYPGAEEILKKAAAESPKSPDAALALGKFYAWRGKPAEAETAFKRAVQLDPQNGQALSSLGALYLSAGRRGEAETIYKQISGLPGKEYKPVYGVFLVLQGRIDEAVVEMEKLWKADPDNRPIRDLLVATYLKGGRVSTAQKLLDDVLKKNSKDVDALLQRSRIAITTGKLTEALNELMALLNFEPNSPSAHFFIARVYELRGSHLQQKQHLAEAVRLAPQWLAARIELANAYVASHNGKVALDTLGGASDQQKRSVEFLVAWNWALISTGDLAAARKSVDRGLAAAPTPDLYLQDGVLKMAAKDYEAARASLQRSLERNPGDLHALNSLIECYAAEKHLDAGIQKARRYIAQRPRTVPNLTFLAEWLVRAGQTADARAVLEAANQISPGNASVQLMLARIDLQERDWNGARRRLSAILTAEPQEPRAHLLMANLETLNGDYQKAIEHYRIAADTGDVTAINNLAYNLSKDDNQLDAALKYAEMAKEIAPDDSYVEDTLGWIYYRKGMYQRAATELETAMAKEARPGVKLHLGLTYVKLGDAAKGRKLAMEAVKDDPSLAASEVMLLSR